MTRTTPHEIFNRVRESDTGDGKYWVEIDAQAALVLADCCAYYDRHHAHEYAGDVGELKRRLRIVAADDAYDAKIEDAPTDTVEIELITYEVDILESAVHCFMTDFLAGVEDAKVGWYDFD